MVSEGVVVRVCDGDILEEGEVDSRDFLFDVVHRCLVGGEEIFCRGGAEAGFNYCSSIKAAKYSS